MLLTLVGLIYLDQTALGDGARSLVRVCLVAPPILMPAGFFLSIALPRSERPNKLIGLVYAGALLLAVAAVTIGVGLLQAN